MEKARHVGLPLVSSSFTQQPFEDVMLRSHSARRLSFATAALLSFALALATPAAAQQSTGSIEGTVTSVASGHPLSDVQVTIVGRR